MKSLSTHGHITGLGIGNNMIEEECGLVGMLDARIAGAIFVDMIKDRNNSGKSLLIVGDSGTGKTALSVGIAKELGERVPFVKISASEVFSAQIKKTEVLQESIRRATSVKIREIKGVYEGEVVDIKIEEREDPLRRYAKTISGVHITLRSLKGIKKITLSSEMSRAIEKERIIIGDIIYVEAENGIIKRLGRSDAYATDYDLESENYLPIPKGEVFRKKEVVQEMTLHEIDCESSMPKSNDVVSIIAQILNPGRREIPSNIRDEVNTQINSYVESGCGEVTSGVLFIDEAHILDSECFSFLNTALESTLCPIIILATNRPAELSNGISEEISLFGIPKDFLDRLLIVRIPEINRDSIRKIIEIRSKKEDNKVKSDVLDLLTDIACNKSLRYSLGLLSTSKILSKDKITTKEAILESEYLFMYKNE